MNKTLSTVAVAAALTALAAGTAHAAVTLDANLEQDNTIVNKGIGLTQGGRVETNVSAKAELDGGFVAAKGTLLIKKDGGTATDDMWVQAGTNAVDLKLGRFEAADLFPAGKDVLVLGGDTGYKANVLRGRMGGSQFHGALTVKSLAGFGVELGLIEEKAKAAVTTTTCTPATETTNVCSTSTSNAYSSAKGLRPVVSFATGPFSVKAGVEAIKTVTNAKQTGVGVTGGYAFDGGSVNLNFAKNSKADAQGIGATLTMGPFGIAAYSGKTAGVKSDTVYAAYSLPLFGIQGATVTPAISTGKLGSGERQSGGRIRFNYTF